MRKVIFFFIIISLISCNSPSTQKKEEKVNIINQDNNIYYSFPKDNEEKIIYTIGDSVLNSVKYTYLDLTDTSAIFSFGLNSEDFKNDSIIFYRSNRILKIGQKKIPIIFITDFIYSDFGVGTSKSELHPKMKILEVDFSGNLLNYGNAKRY